MIQKPLKVSVVIPAYNEENRITDCLIALQSQTLNPYEVIVVDNNSTDQTVVIAKKFAGVKILEEKVQGRAHAQYKGFESAKGDIIARIDADTIVPNDWVEQIINISKTNPDLAAFCGYGRSRSGLTSEISGKFVSWLVFTHCRAYFGSDYLWGSNAVVTKDAWQKAKNLLIKENDIHEDVDLGYAIASTGGKIEIFPNLVVSVDFGGWGDTTKIRKYNRMKIRTKKLHKEHYRSKLPTSLKLPRHRVFYYHLLTIYTLPLFAVGSCLMTAHGSLAEPYRKLKQRVRAVY